MLNSSLPVAQQTRARGPRAPAPLHAPRVRARRCARAAGAVRPLASAAPQQSAAPGGGADWRNLGSSGSVQSADEGDAAGASAPAFQERYFDWRWGSRIRYFTAGESGPPLLLVHG